MGRAEWVFAMDVMDDAVICCAVLNRELCSMSMNASDSHET